MKKIGLTGGIGSGKSTVARVFQLLGVPVFNSDDVAKRLTETDSSVIDKIKILFGNDIYIGGVLDRKAVSEKVFSDKSLLEQLNAIIHPKVGEEFGKWCAEHYNVAYTIKEAAILFESGAYKHLDYNITVHAARKTRIERVVARDNVTAEKVEARMENQLSEQERQDKADFVLNNEGDELLIPQILKLHERFNR